LQLIEIPTAAALLTARAGEEMREAPPTVEQLRSAFWQGVQVAMQGIRLPPSMRLLGYRVVTGSGEPTRVVVVYLGERDIESDAQALIADEVRARLAMPNTELSCERVQSLFGPIGFRRNQASLPAGVSHLFDQIGQILKRHPDLRAEVVAQAEGTERERIAEDRGQAVSNYLSERYGVAAERIEVTAGADAARNIIVKLAPAD
jgi:hypothetical protein